MAIANKNDLTHIVRTTQQWTSSYDSYECIPEGVLCVEFTPDGHVKAKIGNGHDIFSKLPYIGGADLTNYFTKNETVKCIEDIIKAKRFICIKGILQNKDQLPSHAECGDLYFVISQNQSSSNKYDEYVYSPSNTWENLGSIPIDIDLSEYAKIVYVDEKIDEVNERIDDIEQHGTHTHANKDILDLITAAFTAEEKDKLSTLYNYDDTELRELITQASHTHSNKDILDAISAAFTTEDRVKLDSLTPYDDTILKEKITALERLAHEHSNKRILDRTTASFTTEYERKMRWIRIYTGCTGMEEGIAGLVPAAQAGEEDYVLSGSGEWVPQTGGGGTYELPIATTTTLGGIKVGDGLEIDANGVLSTTGGGGGGDSIAEGDGITITTDQLTGEKIISVNAGSGLEIDPVTGELNVTGGGNYSAGEAINIRNVSGNLPPGYVEVDYIEGNGNCYTVIDYIPNRKTKIVGSAALISTTNDPVLFGARTGSNGNQFVLWFNRYDSMQAKVGFVYGTNTWSTSTDCNDGRLIPYVVGEQFTFLLSLDDEFNINDTFVHNITENGAPADYLKLGIFALVDDSLGNIESDNQIFAGRMYEFKIYEDNVLVVELIPAVNSTTGSVGFYDTVNDKFYTSNRSTQFTYDPSTVHVSGKIIDVKYGNGLSVNQDNELEVNTGDGLQINQDGEVEIDPSIIPDVPEYRAGKAIEIEHNEHHLSLTDYSNNDFIASIILSVTNGSISKAADNSSFVLSSSYDDCYTRGSNYGSNGSYPYTVKPLTQYRLQWDSASPGVTGYTMIFENGEYTYVHVGDQGTVSYIDFTTAETTTFIQVRFGIAYAGNTISISNIRLYEYVEDAFEYDKINVKYNKGLVVNRDNELEVVLSDGLQFDSTASETMVADEMYLFDSRVTCQVYGYWQSSSKEYRTFTKLNPESALCCLWEVGSGGSLWTGPLFVGLTATSVQYSSDIQASVSYQNTFNYLGKTWYTSGYPDFLSGADHEDKLGHLQYLGSYAAVTDQIQAAKDLIDLANVRFVSNAGIQAKLGDGLQFDNNGAIEAPVMGASGTNHSSGLVPDPGSTAGTTKFLREDGTWAEPESGGEIYEAGNAISIEETTDPTSFRVVNQEYFFDTRGLTCGLNARVWTTVNDGDILAAMCIHNNGGNQVPLFVGLTEDSVKVSQNYDSNILGPNGSFDYRGKTWYFTADYALSGTDGQDTQNHIQTLPTTYSFSSTPSNFVPAAKDLIDLAVLLSDLEHPVISVKYKEGLTLNQYGELAVNVGDGLCIDTSAIDPAAFTVQNQEYFFNTTNVTATIDGTYGPRSFIKLYADDCLFALCNQNNYNTPILVGLTADSVKIRVDGSYGTSSYGPNITFDYRGKTWYCTSEYGLSNSTMIDQTGTVQSLPTEYSVSVEADYEIIGKDLIDAAILLPSPNVTTVNAKLGNGLSFDANGAIQADAQPLSPATDSTLGGVIVGEGINVDEYGEISLSAGEGLDIDFESPLPSEYTLVKGISSTANGNQYINTGYKIKPTTVIKMTCTIYKRNASQWSIPLGTRNSNNTAYGGLLFVTCWQSSSPYDIPSLWIEGDTSGTASSSDVDLFYNDIIELTFTNNSMTCYNTRTEDTIVLTTSSASVSQPVSYDLFIFATNDVGTAHFFGVMDLYSLQIFEGSTKLYDYIPCQRNSDNKYGLYDIINDEFKLSPNNVAFSYVQGTPTALDLIQQIKLLPATENTIGGVKPGDGILVDNDGTISVDPTIIPEVIEYEAGTAISIEDVEHGGVTFDAWDSGTGWENVCYSDSTGNSVISYQYEAHSPISNSYTLPAGATRIRAIAYNQNDTMLWTSFSWIDSNNYHFASTSPEDGHYDDWFDIPTGAVKVNFGVRHSKLNTITAMSLNDIKSVDITVQTVSEIEVDVWTGVTGWTNGDYYYSTSDEFTTSWPYTYHYNPSEYIPVPEGALKIRVIGISNENDSHFEGGGANIFDSNHHHIGWLPCCTVTDEWVDIPEGTVYVQPEVKWNNNNTRTISAADIKSVTLAWKLPALEINQAINVKYGDGLTVNQNNELEVNLGSGLQFDANGAIEVTGGGGGDTIAEGDGIEITTDQQTGVKTIGVNVGNGLDIDPLTNELFVNGQLPEGTIIKKMTYVGTGAASIDIQFTKKPIAILNIYGDGLDGNRVSTTSAPIDSPTLNMTYGKGTSGAGVVSCNMSYNDTTNVLTLSGGVDEGARCNKSGSTYTMFYLVKGHTGSGTSVNNEVSVIKTMTYTGTGTTSNNIQFPETPDFILSINGKDGVSGDMVVFPFDNLHPSDAHQYIYTYCYNSGISSNYFAGGHGTFDFNPTTNVLTLTGADQGAACNYLDRVYYLRYVVNEVISSSIGGGTNYLPGEGIEFTELTSSVYADKIRLEITNIKNYSSQQGPGAPYCQMRYFEFSDSNHTAHTVVSGTAIWSDGTTVEYPSASESIDVMIDDIAKMCVEHFDGTKSLVLTFDLDSPVLYEDLQYFRYKTGADVPERDPISWKVYFNNVDSVNNWNLAGVVESATITNNREEWTQYFPLTVNEFNSVVISATGGSGDTVAEGNGISITTDQQTGEKVIAVDIGSGLVFDPQTGAINVTVGGGDTVAEGAGISITTDQQTGDKVIAINTGSGLQVNQTTNELEVSSGVVTSIAPTQNTPGSITVTEGDGTATPISVISQMGGATSSTAGTAGYVPAPAAGDDDAYLRGDGTWDDSVVTEDDELTLVFVPDDYQPS